MDFERILFTEEDILNKVKELGKKITEDNQGEELVVIGILRGAFIFMSDIVRHIDTPVKIDFFSLSSYGQNSNSSGVVKIRKDIDTDITGKNVIVLEDIVDTGLTLNYIKDYLEKHNPKSVKLCTLLDKPKAHKTNIKIDYLGFEIENHFVVGYGLDYAESYRNLPYIAILKKEIYS